MRTLLRCPSVVVCLGLAVLAAGPLVASGPPFELEDLFQRTRYREASISPDASLAAAITSRHTPRNEDGESWLHVFDLENGQGQEHRLGAGQFGVLSWSGDSGRLSFLRWGSRFTEIWHWDAASGLLGEIVSGDETRGVFAQFWCHTQGREELRVLSTRSDGRGCELRRVDLERAALGPVVATIRGLFIKEAALSRDGGTMVFTASRDGWHGPGGGPLDLFVLDVATDRLRELTAGDGIASKPAVTADGALAACGWMPGQVLFSTSKREILCFAPSDRRPPARLTQDWDPSLGDGIFGVNEKLFLTPERGAVITATQQGMADHVMAFRLDGGMAERLSAGDYSYKGFSLAENARRGVSVQSGPSTPERLFLHDLESGTGRVIHDPNTRLRQFSGGRHDVVAFRGEGGLIIEGLLLRPLLGQAPYPLVCILHGGSSGRHTLRFNEAFSQAFAALGYAVFLPNPRGSAGYPAAFGSANVGDFGGREVDDIAAGIEHLIDQGHADPGRVFLSGHSYGGFLVQMLLARSRLPRAAVSIAGVSDWLSFYETTDLPGLVIDGMGGTPGDCLAQYREASPLSHVERIRAPLLLVHGAFDQRVPAEQSQRMQAALEQQGVDSKLLLFADEGHVFRSQRTLLDVMRSAHAWFQQHGAELPRD